MGKPCRAVFQHGGFERKAFAGNFGTVAGRIKHVHRDDRSAAIKGEMGINQLLQCIIAEMLRIPTHGRNKFIV